MTVYDVNLELMSRRICKHVKRAICCFQLMQTWSMWKWH